MVPLSFLSAASHFLQKFAICSAFSSKLFYEKHVLEGTLNIHTYTYREERKLHLQFLCGIVLWFSGFMSYISAGCALLL